MQGNRTRTMKRHLLLLRLTVVIVVLSSTWMMPSAVAAVERRPTPKLVWINKCCPNGEQLEKSRVCVNGPSRGWVPLVFLSRRNKHFEPQGEAPNFFRVNANTRPKSCQKPEMYVGLDKFAIFSNGSLFLSEKSAVISAEDYCVDREASLVCFPEIHGMDSLIAPKKLSRVRKCCGRDMAYDEVNRTCVFLTEPGHPLRRTSIVNSSNVEIIYGFPECNNRTDYAIAGKFRYELLNIETGNLILDSGKRFKSDDFCLEHSINNDYDPNSKSAYVNMFACSEHFSEPEVISVTRNDLRFLLYPIGLFISVIFLLATLAAGFLIPSNHHVLHWRCQTYYVACLLVGDLLLASTQLSGTAIEGTACILMAIFMHFFFLAAFFWLNTMCFNIWWTFRDFRPTSLEKGQELFRLRIYRIYAWGVPLIICSIAAIFDLIPRSPDDKFLRPRFDEARCWFYGDMEIFAYFFGPIAILLCINILLFASTTRQLTCGLWKRDDVKSTTERAALGRVCLKLVIVMGVTWVADIISWLVGGPQYVWYLTDLINALQGVFIFIVVGCQPQVWSAIKRIWSSKTGRGVTNTTNGPQHSSSSHGLPSIGESVTHNTLTNTTSTKVPMETVC